MQGDTVSYCAAAINDAATRLVLLMVIEWLSGSCFKKTGKFISFEKLVFG